MIADPAPDAVLVPEMAVTPAKSSVGQAGEAWRMFRRNKAGLGGLVVLTLILLATLLGPYLYPIDPFEIVSAPLMPPPGPQGRVPDTFRRGHRLARCRPSRAGRRDRLHRGRIGSGKSMTALAIMGLVPQPNGSIGSGSIRFAGEDLVQATAPRMRDLRGKELAMIFQEPMTALNPVFTIGDQIAESLRLHEGLDRRSALQRASDLLKMVGIPAPERRVREYPHQLSGGMRQRAMIAMALACRPKLLIADEPTTALDVTVQAQILDLLKDIQVQFGTAILLITHDMGVVADVADRVAVMYAGRKVEEGRAADVLSRPSHPYTRALISCIPHLDDGTSPRAKLREIPGMVPSLLSLPPGCPYAPRCSHTMARCIETFPPDFTAGPAHISACWLLDREMAA